MALFNIIRDFYVNYIFGGWTSGPNNTFVEKGFIFAMFRKGGVNSTISTGNVFIELPFQDVNGSNALMSFGDWCSTTATIITLIVILCCIAYFIRWIFKVCSNAILLR